MRRWFVLLLLSTLYSGIAEAADNKSQAALSDSVQVRVWSVHATKQGASVDDGLKRLAKHLRALNYGTFRLLRKDGVAVPPKGTRKIDIIGNKSVRVTVLDRNAERARVRVQIGNGGGNVLDTTVSIRRNGFFIVAGPRHDGGILVLPIFARY